MIYQGVELHNVAEVYPSTHLPGVTLSRVPESVRLQLSERGQVQTFNTCGCEVRFNLDSERASLVLQREVDHALQNPYGILEVYHGCFPADWVTSPRSVGPQPGRVFVRRPANLEQLIALTEQQGLPFDPRLVRVILPYDGPTRLLEIEGEVSPPRPEQLPTRRLLAYGSSITHGGSAVRPTESYAMHLARLLRCDLRNFGFSGSAELEVPLAQHMAGLEWDVATLELGINVIGVWSLERFEAAVTAFLSAFSAGQGPRWVYCTDLFSCYRDLEGDPEIGRFREAVRRSVERVNHPRLVHFPGAQMLDPATGLTTDLVHPSSEGMAQIARGWAEGISAFPGSLGHSSFQRVDRRVRG